jgi:hypothetical protein
VFDGVKKGGILIEEERQKIWVLIIEQAFVLSFVREEGRS